MGQGKLATRARSSDSSHCAVGLRALTDTRSGHAPPPALPLSQSSCEDGCSCRRSGHAALLRLVDLHVAPRACLTTASWAHSGDRTRQSASIRAGERKGRGWADRLARPDERGVELLRCPCARVAEIDHHSLHYTWMMASSALTRPSALSDPVRQPSRPSLALALACELEHEHGRERYERGPWRTLRLPLRSGREG